MDREKHFQYVCNLSDYATKLEIFYQTNNTQWDIVLIEYKKTFHKVKGYIKLVIISDSFIGQLYLQIHRRALSALCCGTGRP